LNSAVVVCFFLTTWVFFAHAACTENRWSGFIFCLQKERRDVTRRPVTAAVAETQTESPARLSGNVTLSLVECCENENKYRVFASPSFSLSLPPFSFPLSPLPLFLFPSPFFPLPLLSFSPLLFSLDTSFPFLPPFPFSFPFLPTFPFSFPFPLFPSPPFLFPFRPFFPFHFAPFSLSISPPFSLHSLFFFLFPFLFPFPPFPFPFPFLPFSFSLPFPSPFPFPPPFFPSPPSISILPFPSLSPPPLTFPPPFFFPSSPFPSPPSFPFLPPLSLSPPFSLSLPRSPRWHSAGGCPRVRSAPLPAAISGAAPGSAQSLAAQPSFNLSLIPAPIQPDLISSHPSLAMPQLRVALLLLALLLASAAAESVRETETMDARWLDYPGSGDLPDDEDIGKFKPPSPSDGLDTDETSGSGDYPDSEDAIYLTTMDTPLISDNYIPGDRERKIEGEKKNTMLDNEIIPDKALPVEENLSNKISMASTANSSIFERTEVLTALIAGGAVGLLFAVFLILLLVYRMKKKDEGSYDLGKKPIYKKAPTNEFYA
uniref:Syndecan n=1 Tax=Anas platyrhynchos platyrhynchos TaxID=8840 RepID=A0A493TKJ9_ANAPP